MVNLVFGRPLDTRDVPGPGEGRTSLEAALAANSPERAETVEHDAIRRRWGRRLHDVALGLGIASKSILAGLLLVVSLPWIMAAMTVIALTSRGPALYTQWRVGQGGRRFKMYKIRTMIHNCECESGPRWATPGDPRATRFGRILRRTHLDELPQLWNILRGDMNFVGPRPERPEIIDGILSEIPSYLVRTSVKPGLTGLAQVLQDADVNMNSVRRKLVCDRYYILRRGWSLNCRIILATPFRMIGLPAAFLVSLFGLPSLEECRRFVDAQEADELKAVDPQSGAR